VKIINNNGELKGAITVRTEALLPEAISDCGCIILLGDEGKFGGCVLVLCIKCKKYYVG
jgi:hypothetical protein